jgi:molecular chaperone GrpE
MRIPITINNREDPWRRNRAYSLSGYPPATDEYIYGREGTGRGLGEPSTRKRTNLAIDHEAAGREESKNTVKAGEEALREKQIQARKENASGTEESREDWKERYVRLRADFENYKRHTEAQREKLAGIGREEILEDVFPLVEHMERAIREAKNAGDRAGILEGIEMVHRELLRVLGKHGIERIGTVGEPFDPKIHEAVAAAPHPDYPEDTVVEEVRAGFVKDGRLLRPASVVVAK